MMDNLEAYEAYTNEWAMNNAAVSRLLIENDLKSPEVRNFRAFVLLSIDEKSTELYFGTVQFFIEFYTFGYFSLR